MAKDVVIKATREGTWQHQVLGVARRNPLLVRVAAATGVATRARTG